MGWGKNFIGIYDRFNKRIEQFRVDEGDRFIELNEDGELSKDHPLTDSGLYNQALEEITLLDVAGNEFSIEKSNEGTISPVFFRECFD